MRGPGDAGGGQAMDDQQEPGSVTSARTPEPDATSSAPEPGGSDSGAEAGKPKKKKSFTRELLTIVVAAAVLTLLVKAFLVQVYRIPSASKEHPPDRRPGPG